jgi:hypothetical protein
MLIISSPFVRIQNHYKGTGLMACIAAQPRKKPKPTKQNQDCLFITLVHGDALVISGDEVEVNCCFHDCAKPLDSNFGF